MDEKEEKLKKPEEVEDYVAYKRSLPEGYYWASFPKWEEGYFIIEKRGNLALVMNSEEGFWLESGIILHKRIEDYKGE